MQATVRLGFVAASIWLGTGDTRSATIERFSNGSSPAFFSIEGTIEEGDDKRFVDQVLGVDFAVIFLSSDGGNIGAAIRIGQAIRLKGFGTGVLDGTLCASACGLIWLAGQPRFMTERTQIGFHAAYDLTDGTPRERGAPNAVVGAYLGALGLSQRAILYVTAASPDQMQWLTIADASAFGIDVQQLDIPSGPMGGPIESRSTPGLAPANPSMLATGDIPQFREYPADDSLVTTRAPVDLTSPDAWTFRTRLRNAAKQEPNFAGQYVIASWGCGATCVTGANVNLATGKVVFLPGSVCCWGRVDENFKALEFRRNSRLLVMSGLINEEGDMGAHFFVFDGGSFNFLTTIKTSSDFGASLGKEQN